MKFVINFIISMNPVWTVFRLIVRYKPYLVKMLSSIEYLLLTIRMARDLKFRRLHRWLTFQWLILENLQRISIFMISNNFVFIRKIDCTWITIQNSLQHCFVFIFWSPLCSKSGQAILDYYIVCADFSKAKNKLHKERHDWKNHSPIAILMQINSQLYCRYYKKTWFNCSAQSY